MEQDKKTHIGLFLTKFSLAGLFLTQLWRFLDFIRIQNSIDSILKNPEIDNLKIDVTEIVHLKPPIKEIKKHLSEGGKIVYLNGPITITDDPEIFDAELGFKTKALSLIREVEKLQWAKHNSLIYNYWSKDILPDLIDPSVSKNSLWEYHSTRIDQKSLVKINGFYILTSNVIKYLNYEKCDLDKMAYENPGQKNLTKYNDEITEFTSKHIEITTANKDKYKIKYKYIPHNQRISVLGLSLANHVFPYYNVYIEKGDVPLEDMLKKIHVPSNGNYTAFLFFTLLCGLTLQSKSI